MTLRLFRFAVLPLLTASAVLGAESPLPRHSPFAPPGAPVAVAPLNETLEFAGVSSIGKKVDLIIYDKAAKKSRWIAVGETVDGISVVGYDPQLERAVLRVDGAEKMLSLRKPATAPRHTPAPVAPIPVGFNIAPPLQAAPADSIQKIQPPPPPGAQSVPAAESAAAAPAGPQTPDQIRKAETEARMLVSDLLEIGMAQRKAYEEAQRRGAEGNSGDAPQPAANAPQPSPNATPPSR